MDSKTSFSTGDTGAFVKRVHQRPLQGVGLRKWLGVGMWRKHSRVSLRRDSNWGLPLTPRGPLEVGLIPQRVPI